MLSTPNKYKLPFSIGLLSAAIIAFQLALMQILSIVQWYHFAYMIISVAILAFGAAGSVLAIFRNKLLKHIQALLPLLILTTGIAMTFVTDLTQLAFVRFDSWLLFAEYNQVSSLLLTYLLFFIPFFPGALAIGLIFVHYVDTIGKIYFSNLVGSGAGGLLILTLTGSFLPSQLPVCIAILPVVAGIIIAPKTKRIFYAGITLIAAALILWKLSDPGRLILSQYKDISKTMLLPEATITAQKPGAYGFIQTVTAPALRYAPGLSLAAQHTAKVKMAVFVNGDWFGVITDKEDSTQALDYTTLALPYIMAKRHEVLVLRAGTGIDVAYALKKNAKKVVAVEPNATWVSMLKKEIGPATDSLIYHPKMQLHNVEARTFLLMDDARYDLVVVPVVGTFGGSAGLFALQEQFSLTKEAFYEMWLKLKKEGAITITSWMDYPARNPLKILATMVEVLEDAGVNDPKNHIAAIRSWGTITFVMTKSPLSKQAIENTRNFCETMLFDPAILPGLKRGERARYNQLQDSSFFDLVDKIFLKERKTLYETYDFNIQPATDNKPYFSQFIRWKSISRLADFFGNRSIPFFEIGYLLVWVTLVQISILSAILILLPLFKIGWKGKNKRSIILYFGGIALGYMFVEMVFIQRFILYFGSPVYAASAVITSLLIFSGIGSYTSRYFFSERKYLRLIFAGIVVILLCYSFLLTPLLQHTVQFSIAYKLLIVLLLIAPPAFCMGIPFPAGLHYVSKQHVAEIPWAWGINSCISVISTALAIIVAVELGFIWVMLMAALAYCLSLMASLKWKI